MKFSMKLPLVDVVCDDSLKNIYINGEKLGYEFQIRLSNYRGHYLSCIEEFGVTVDGNEIGSDDICFCLNEKEFTVRQLPSLISEFWKLSEPATIKVYAPGGLTEGEHLIDVKLLLRVPYMPVPGSKKDHEYALLDSCGSKTLLVKELVMGA
jgi:Domain of unknown function (DUF6379)